MTTHTLHLGAPSHAVEPALLAQRLPTLTAALGLFCAADAVSFTNRVQTDVVHVYAALLGVQRDHITLEHLPEVGAESFAQLQTRAALLASDFAADGLVFTAGSADIYNSKNNNNNNNSGSALGTLNISAALPPAANFIGRDIAKALPRDAASRVLRQFVNGAQMALHQTPVHGCEVNSLWCSHALPTDVLSSTWLQGGLTQWWDALPVWDSTLDLTGLTNLTALGLASRLELVYSDVTIAVPLKRRSAWMPWLEPLALASVLNA
jgi:hypothetical protein